jgi:hypothetical protein
VPTYLKGNFGNDNNDMPLRCLVIETYIHSIYAKKKTKNTSPKSPAKVECVEGTCELKQQWMKTNETKHKDGSFCEFLPSAGGLCSQGNNSQASEASSSFTL